MSSQHTCLAVKKGCGGSELHAAQSQNGDVHNNIKKEQAASQNFGEVNECGAFEVMTDFRRPSQRRVSASAKSPPAASSHTCGVLTPLQENQHDNLVLHMHSRQANALSSSPPKGVPKRAQRYPLHQVPLGSKQCTHQHTAQIPVLLHTYKNILTYTPQLDHNDHIQKARESAFAKRF